MVKGHKCQGVSISVSCECGWTSARHKGNGARGAAYAEWQIHVERCVAAENASAKAEGSR